MHRLLNFLDHRNEELPDGRWIMSQNWDYLMCMHIPLSPEEVSRHIPKSLELDTYDGKAWISIFPFYLRQMRLRGLPKFPYFHQFLELNVRTYVKYKGISGVYFFSLDAAKIMPVIGARSLTELPYYRSKMKSVKNADWTHFKSRRLPKLKPRLEVRYKPISTRSIPSKNSIDYWLFERYYLFNEAFGCVYHIGIHHLPWQPREASVVYNPDEVNDLLPGNLEGTPTLAHYHDSLEVLFWPPKWS